MTELEMIDRARMYVQKLANGVNPTDGSEVPDGDVVNDVRISRCLFFVADVLRQVLENGGAAPAPKAEKSCKGSHLTSHSSKENASSIRTFQSPSVSWQGGSMH